MAENKALDVLYSAMRVCEGQVGGGEGVEGIYGTITKNGTSQVMNALAGKCGMDGSSTLVDIGAGLARPLLHALVEPGVGGAYGVEVDAVKCMKAEAFISRVSKQVVDTISLLNKSGGVSIKCVSMEEAPTLDPATHAYSFWEGIPESAKASFGDLFASSSTLKGVAVVQRAFRGDTDPAACMAERGFPPLRLEDAFPVSMSGSGRSMTAYVFSRVGPFGLPGGAEWPAVIERPLGTPKASLLAPRAAKAVRPGAGTMLSFGRARKPRSGASPAEGEGEPPASGARRALGTVLDGAAAPKRQRR